MKRLVLLFLTVCVNLSLHSQQDDTYLSQINLDVVKTKTEEKLNTLLSQYDFPKDYERFLEAHITEFEYNKQVVKFKYSNSDQMVKTDSLKNVFEDWRNSQKANIRLAKNLWFKTKSRFDLGNEFKNDFVAYHFYIAISNPDELIVSNITKLSKLNSLKAMIEKMARHETERIVELSSALKKIDTPSVNYGIEILYNHLKDNLIANLNTSSSLDLIKNTNAYKTIIVDAAREKQQERNAKGLEKQNELFIAKAIEIGLTTGIANNILDLIEKRKNDLEALKNSSNNEDDMSNLFENTDAKTKSEIKQEFAQGLANLITKSQFTKLFSNEFLENTNNKTQDKLESLKNSYELSEEQANELAEMLKNFYFNQQIIIAYYSFDKKLKKQKLSALRYRFEKDYKSLMETFGIPVKPVKKMDQRTFKWD